MMTVAAASDAPIDGFGGSAWGTALAEIRTANADEKPSESSETFLAYKRSVAGIPVMAVYRCGENGLESGMYLCKDEFANPQSYVESYRQLAKSLSEKYGPPAYDETTFKDDIYRKQPDRLGMAIAAERASMFAEWKRGDAVIRVRCAGKQFAVNTVVIYQANAQADAKKAEAKQKAGL